MICYFEGGEEPFKLLNSQPLEEGEHMKRPRIGVSSWHYRSKDDQERWEYVQDLYTRSVYRAGGLPLILPMPDATPDLLEDYLGSIDGVLFTGGADIHPELYGETIRSTCGEPDRERD